MTQPTKTDERAADRLLKKAVYIAIADLKIAALSKKPDAYYRVFGKNTERFTTAIEAAQLLLAADPQEGTA